MPSASEILTLLKQTSNDLIFIAIAFHFLVMLFAGALINGWRPSKQTTGMLLSIPLLSVSVIAWIYGNPFNGLFFGIFFVLLFFLAYKLPREAISFPEKIWFYASLLLIVFGMFYPHFLDTHPALYLIGAPMGLIPCPTLSMVIGFTMLFNHFNSKWWALTLTIIGLFYGIFGVMKLHVYIDVVLILGSLLLLVEAFFSHRATEITEK